MNISSEYTFPIFISSTDYNLKDFRAELARFLTELGYRPILSSSEGFPDSSPKLEPWESCIPVLDQCFVVILVIDGRYSTALKWPNMKDIFSDEKYSPTHGEYLYTHRNNKRMLVFVRREVMIYYQAYREAHKNLDGKEDEIKKALEAILPKHIDYETLKFVAQVKTTKPIPWIKEFDDITDVKKEVQKKLLNELAEVFLIKEKRLEIVIESFNKIFDTLSSEEQTKVLSKVNATKEFTTLLESHSQLEDELKNARTALEQAETGDVTGKKILEDKIKNLERKILELESTSMKSSSDFFYVEGGKVKFGIPNQNIGTQYAAGISDSDYFLGYYNLNPKVSGVIVKKCSKCGKPDLTSSSMLLGNGECSKCKKHYCNECWPKTLAYSNIGEAQCPECKSQR